MPKTNTKANSRSIRRVAIDGHFLDDVRTRLHSDGSSKSLSYLSAPVERHHATEDEEGVTLRLPALELTVAGRIVASQEKGRATPA